MPMSFDHSYRAVNWKDVERARAAVTRKLIAKGLKEGHGKWGEVFARHYRKMYRT
jgi:hypothetical protein